MKRVGLFASCLIDQLYPHVGFKVAETVQRLGFEVVVPPNQTCCGQPAFNTGFPDEARPVLQQALDCMRHANVDAFLIPSGSCTSMLRVFSRELVGNDPFLDRIFEFSEFVARFAQPGQLTARFNGRVVYHDGCHQLRALGIREAPRQLLRSVRGLELVELPEPVCCGFGGTFCVKMPEISRAMLDDKVRAIEATGADAVVSGDMGCLMQIASGLKAARSSVRALHLAEVLAL
jgi:L-lactate dehydrogenase complex protein LldE